MASTYRQTLAALYALEAKKGMDFRLSRLDPVLEALGHPQRAFACVHVAGTNGKGSTSAMVEAAFRAGGHRTGLYTSPHVVSFRERIRIAGVPISREAVVRRVAEVETAGATAKTGLTFFEIATLMAFLEMREAGVDVAVIEAGLGGRLDATNVAHGDVAVLTSVGIDHAEFLGSTIEEIAREKAAIIKAGSVAITGALPISAAKIVAARAEEVDAKLLVHGRDFDDFEPLFAAQQSRPGQVPMGAHQLRNAAVAAAAVEALGTRFPVTTAERDAAILAVRWPGRLEMLPRRQGRGSLVLDAAHNPEGAVALASSLDSVAPERPRVLVFASMGDKDWRAVLTTLAPCFDRVVVAPLPMQRAAAPALFQEVVPDAILAPSAEQALDRAEEIATAHGSVVVAGSIFLLGHLYRYCGGAFLENDLDDSVD